MRRTVYQAAIVIAVCTVLLGACNALNLSQQPDDKAIASEIQAKLFQDPVLKTRDIRVVSQKGVVALSGTVSTDQEKATVESLAGQASGVKQVINQLTVLGSSATPSRLRRQHPSPPQRPRHAGPPAEAGVLLLRQPPLRRRPRRSKQPPGRSRAPLRHPLPRRHRPSRNASRFPRGPS